MNQLANIDPVINARLVDADRHIGRHGRLHSAQAERSSCDRQLYPNMQILKFQGVHDASFKVERFQCEAAVSSARLSDLADCISM